MALGFCGCQARTVAHSKKNEVALSVLPQTWWLVVATDVGRAVLACLRLADKDGRVVLACVRLVEEDGRFWSAAVATRGIAVAGLEGAAEQLDAAGGEDT